MFQFPGFPTYTYVFSIRFITLRYEGFPIRISTDRSSFAAPRSFSQLVTSFFGSWCQGIHLMLLFAWTFLTFQFSSFELLEFHITNNFWLSILCEKVLSFLLWIVFHLSVKLYFTQIGKTLIYFANLLVKSLSSYLFVSYSSILYSVFKEHIWKQHTVLFSKGKFYLMASPSPCFRKDVKLASPPQCFRIYAIVLCVHTF